MEKGQGVLMVLVVSPLRSWEYVLSKVLSLALVSVLVALSITYFSDIQNVNWLILMLSTIFTSGIFTLLGIMINAGCSNVNQYLLKTIPYMLLFILPCFALLGFPYSEFFIIFPSVAALKLMLGAYHGISCLEAIAISAYLLAINFLLLKMAVHIFEKRIVYQD